MAIAVWQRDRAGRSAETKFKALRRTWRRRRIGRPFTFCFVGIYMVSVVLASRLLPQDHLALWVGFGLGAIATGWWTLPDLIMPAQIHRWQQGAWGEQKTASELVRLDRKTCVVRHDVAWGTRANHDHVVAGRSVYLLNTKNIPDSSVKVEARALRVTLIDNRDDSYLADQWVPSVEREAAALKTKLEAELAFPVWVNPVIVLWAAFPEKEAWIDGKVAVVHGLHLIDWLAGRPTDLPNLEKRERVRSVVRSLPSAARRDRSVGAQASSRWWTPGWR